MSTTDYQFKLVLVGDAKAGKSSLLMNYVCATFSSTYIASTGTDFKSKTITGLADGIGCKLEIWDTAGPHSLQSSFGRFFRNAQGALLCYDVCNKASFQNMTKYLQQVQMNAPVDCVVFVVACKGDCLYSRKVPASEGEKFAASRRCGFREVSAKTGSGVEALFQAVAAAVLKQQLQQGGQKPPSSTLSALTNPGGAGEAETAAAAAEGGEQFINDGEDGDTMQFRRSTLTEGAAGTGSRLLESAYPLYISGARSWYNSAKINGRYVPQLTRLSRFDAVEVFCYWNVDCTNTVMLYSDNHWVVKRNRKELARLPSPSIECFPDEANRKTSWRENTGVYFTWLHLRPDIRCAALQASPAAAIQQGAGSRGGGGGGGIPRSSASFSGSPGGTLGATGAAGAGLRASFSDRDRDSLSSYSEHGTSGSASRVYRGQHGGGPGTQERGSSFSYKMPHASSNSSSNCLAAACNGSSSKGSGGGGGGSGIFASILLLPMLQPDSGSSLIIINMDAFYRCSRDPQRALGLTPLLFCQYLQLRLALLELEYKAAPGLLDAATLVQICAQSKRMQETCADMLVAAGLPSAVPTTPTPSSPAPASVSGSTASILSLSAKESGNCAPPVPPTAEGILQAGKVFLKGLARQLVALCALDTGSVEQAGRCRDVKVEVEAFLDELRAGQGGGAGRGSFSMSGRASFSFSSRSSFSGSAW